MLVHLKYNPSKQSQEKVLGELSYNLDYAIGQANTVHVLGDFNLNCLNKIEKNNLESNITPYDLQIVNVHETIWLAKNSQSHIDYIVTEIIEENRQYTFDTPFKTDHLASRVVIDINLIKCQA